MKKSIVLFLFCCFTLSFSLAQRVAIGHTTPAAMLDIRGVASPPTIPSSNSTGILRIGVSANEGIDIGKMDSSPFSGWMQSGFNGNSEPLSLQPLGGNLGVGTTNPVTKLNITGVADGPTIPGTSSTGIMRIGVGPFEAIDIGKMSTAPYAGWIQSGYNSSAEPLSLQPLGSSVGIGTSNPAASAVLDVSSNSKGFLPPRMTLTDRNNIASPVAGLTIWCSNCGFHGELQVYNGMNWTGMTGEPAKGLIEVGLRDGGGVVAYILQSGDPGYVAGQVHGLIASLMDIPADLQWGCEPFGVPGADGIAIGAGNQNTIDIMNFCYDVQIAAEYCGVFMAGGYTDWYLPSKNELNRLYVNREVIGGFLANWHWSSSEVDDDQAWGQDFNLGYQIEQLKHLEMAVRPVRSF